MNNHRYAVPPGGVPDQRREIGTRANFTNSYALIPASSQRDVVTSRLPNWNGTKLWVLARPMSGFSETFSHYVLEVESGGGSDVPETAFGVEAVLFVTAGRLEVSIDGLESELIAGSYVYLSVDASWRLHNRQDEVAVFHWIRKRYEAIEGMGNPSSFVTCEMDVEPEPMPHADGRWTTRRFVDVEDCAHDMHVNLVELQPGAKIPFAEMHVMEHGLYVLEGQALYLLNQDWVEVNEGDYMWLRAFCPQACIASGTGPFRYLLYKDVNRHAALPGGLGR
ncbi:MAG: bifunctional allantoicase/(S)-ureidoglycine aminohydrolase [Rhodobacteraceae bacterium]|nr:bifunctional allantoicase/(S)-ureidoglycine aminohydrolase [Paracoccaceae bacterium]